MPRAKVNSYMIPSGSQEQRILTMLRTLELEGAVLSLSQIVAHAEEKRVSYLDFLEDILEKNFVFNEQRRLDRWLQQARFPQHKTLEEFDFTRNTTIDQRQINQLASGGFIEKGRNLIFMGPSGVGKTHLSIALGVEAIARGFEVRFLKLNQLVELVQRTELVDIPRVLRSLMRAKLLILDDIDFYDVSQIANVNEFLFSLVDKRHEAQLSTIYITNKSFSEWQLFGDDMARSKAALDRILGSAILIQIDGKSQRIATNEDIVSPD